MLGTIITRLLNGSNLSNLIKNNQIAISKSCYSMLFGRGALASLPSICILTTAFKHRFGVDFNKKPVPYHSDSEAFQRENDVILMSKVSEMDSRSHRNRPPTKEYPCTNIQLPTSRLA